VNIKPVNTTNTKSCAQLSLLASHLDKQHDAILKRWRAVTEKDPELIIASSLTRLQFNDHIPGVLDTLSDKLRSWPGEESERIQLKEKEQVTAHGLQRWQQGYQLRELTREWGHLQTSLMEELEAYALTHPDLETQVMPTARSALSNLCWDGISESATQYWQLHQTEAAGRVQDLEQAFTALKDLGLTRAEGWRWAAHDLGGSVIAVKGAASLLQSDDMPERQVPSYNLLQNSVSLLHELLNELMSLARLEAGQEQRNLESFDAAALLAEHCKASQPLAQQRGLFLKMQGPESLLVEGDRPKIQRILQNLLLNAIKYTQTGGVTVIWEAGTDSNTKKWMFCVLDTGPGLNAGPDAPLAKQLHEATQTANEANVLNGAPGRPGDTTNAPTVPAESQPLPPNQQPGEGVGLSIVKRLCELLDASLELETRPGEGSTFRVILPRHYGMG